MYSIFYFNKYLCFIFLFFFTGSFCSLSIFISFFYILKVVQNSDLLCMSILKNGKKLVCGQEDGVLGIFSWDEWGDFRFDLKKTMVNQYGKEKFWRWWNRKSKGVGTRMRVQNLIFNFLLIKKKEFFYIFLPNFEWRILVFFRIFFFNLFNFLLKFQWSLSWTSRINWISSKNRWKHSFNRISRWYHQV